MTRTSDAIICQHVTLTMHVSQDDSVGNKTTPSATTKSSFSAEQYLSVYDIMPSSWHVSLVVLVEGFVNWRGHGMRPRRGGSVIESYLSSRVSPSRL